MFFPQQQAPQTDCMTTITNWWASMPLGVKFLFISTTLLYALDWPFNGYITYLLADIPLLTFKGYLWRIFLAQFVHGNLINLLFSLLSVYFSAVQLENTIGTVTFLVDVMIKNVLLQMLYLTLVGLLSFLIPMLLVVQSYGLWNLAMIYISLRSFSRPEEDTQFLCFPIAIKNKYYPIAIVVFVNLFAFPRLDLLAAALLGYIEYRFFAGMLFRPTQGRVNQLAQSFLFRSTVGRPDFVPYDGRLVDQGFQARPVNAPAQTQEPSFKEYGGKGVQIGSDAFASSSQARVYPQAQYYDHQGGDPQTYPTEYQDPRIGSQLQGSDLESQKVDPQQPLTKPKNKNYNQLGEELP